MAEQMNLKGLLLVGSPQCAPCARAAQWLSERGVPFHKVSVVQPDGKPDERLAKWVVAQTQQNTVPQFFYNGVWVRQGFQLVQELVEQGRIPSGQRR